MNITKKLPFSSLSFGVGARWSGQSWRLWFDFICQRLQLLTTEKYKIVCEVLSRSVGFRFLLSATVFVCGRFYNND